MPDHTTSERLANLERLREQALHPGSPAAVERHRAKGKLLAGERIELLLDPGSSSWTCSCSTAAPTST